MQAEPSPVALVGGYGPEFGGSSAGVGVVRLGDGPVEYLGVAAELPAPSWLLVSGQSLFVIDEFLDEVVSFRVEADALRRLGSVRVPGTANCHLAFDGGRLVTCSYGEGLVSWLPLQDGVAGPPARVRELFGSGAHPDQSRARAHSSLSLGDGRVLVADLGADLVRVFAEHGERELGSVPLPAGFGPRDLAPLPDGRVLLLGEFAGLALLDTSAGLPTVAAVTATPWLGPDDHAAAIGMLPDGSIVTGVRGADLLARVRVDGDSVSPVDTVPAGVAWPRYLLANGPRVWIAGQRSDSVASHALDPEGRLRLVGRASVPTPTHLVLGRHPAWAALAGLLG